MSCLLFIFLCLYLLLDLQQFCLDSFIFWCYLLSFLKTSQCLNIFFLILAILGLHSALVFDGSISRAYKKIIKSVFLSKHWILNIYRRFQFTVNSKSILHCFVTTLDPEPPLPADKLFGQQRALRGHGQGTCVLSRLLQAGSSSTQPPCHPARQGHPLRRDSGSQPSPEGVGTPMLYIQMHI